MMTVVYYTCNGDFPRLEEAVRQTILDHSNGLPIVSVSHKPLDFGRNICVGPIEKSRSHILMQLRVATELATTPFVAVCEADTLYPPEFFRFQPSRDDTYYFPEKGYIAWRQTRGRYYRKKMHQLTGIIARNHLLNLLDKLQTMKEETIMMLVKYIPRVTRLEDVDLGPVVTLKTGRGLHKKSPYSRHDKTDTLPIWGPSRQMWRQYRCA